MTKIARAALGIAAAVLVIAGCGGGGSSGGSGHSHSYQEGFNDASGEAIRQQVFSGLSAADACSDGFNIYKVSDSELNESEFVQGCQDGLGQNPVKSSTYYTP
ncbi:hypothetical protein [Mycolicibacterium lutetiense]